MSKLVWVCKYCEKIYKEDPQNRYGTFECERCGCQNFECMEEY